MTSFDSQALVQLDVRWENAGYDGQFQGDRILDITTGESWWQVVVERGLPTLKIPR